MAEAIQNNWWGLLLFGAFVGTFAGMFGLGGGAVIVPLLVLVFGMNQKGAQGTSLAMILAPTAIPAILDYHRGGYVEWRLVLWVAPTMLLGSFLGSRIAQSLPQDVLKVAFAIVLTYVAAYMVFSKLDSIRMAIALSMVPVGVTLLLALFTGVFARVARTAPPTPAEAAANAAAPATQSRLPATEVD